MKMIGFAAAAAAKEMVFSTFYPILGRN